MWSFSYTNENAGYADFERQAIWANHWTVKQIETVTPGTYRLRFTVATDSFSQWPQDYVWNCTDSIVYGGSSIAVHEQTRVNAAYAYTADIDVPASWNGKEVEFRIAELKQAAYFKVKLELDDPPAITVQPANVTTSADSAVFRVTATGAESYQWQFRSSSSGSWAAVSGGAYSGAKSASLTVTTSGRSGYQFRCVVKNTAGTVNSNAATLTVQQVTPSPSALNVADGKIGGAVPITLTQVPTGARHTVTVTRGGTVIETIASNSTATSFSWKPTAATYYSLATSARLDVRVICETFINGSSIGTRTKDIYLSFGSGSFAASTIAAANGTFGSSIPISLTRAFASTKIRHKMKVVCSGREVSLLSNSTATSATWSPIGTNYAPIASDQSTLSATITCETYFYDAKIGTATKTINVSFAAGSVAASTVTATNGTFGSAVPISLTRACAGVKHLLRTSCAGVERTLLNKSTATTANWVPAVATYAPEITAAVSAQATITCETWIGDVKVGEATKTITLSFAAGTLLPTVATGWANAAPLNTGAVAGLTGYIQGYSKARVTFDDTKITTQYGAAIASRSISCMGVTDSSSPYDTPVLTGTSATITRKVTDSRGRSKSYDLDIEVMPYVRPRLSAITVYRCDSGRTAAEEGTYIAVKATATVSPLDGQNTGSMKVFTRPTGGSWTDRGSLTSATLTRIGSGSTFSPDTSYEVKIELTDTLGNKATVTRGVASRRWAMKFRPDGNGVAFGKTAEASQALEIPESWQILRGGKDYLGGVRLMSFELAPGATAALTFPNATATAQNGMILSSALYLTGRGIIAYSNYNGSSYTTVLAGATGLTISASGNTISIENTTSARVMFAVLSLSGSLPTVA